jgi:phosphatidylinositol alpha-1,6-mannosyltransferase
MAKRSLLLAADFPPQKGGISQYLYDITRFLPPTSIRVLGLPTSGWQEFDSLQHFSIQRLGVPERWDPLSAQFKLLAPAYLAKALQIPRFDVLLCGQAHHSLMIPALMIHRMRGTPFGIFTYGLDLLRPQRRIQRPLFNWLLRQADLVFAISERTADIAGSLGVRNDNIRVIYPAVNISRLQIEQSPTLVRERHGLIGKRIILSLGRLVERKGFDTVIRAMPMILAAVPNAHYLIVGNGDFREALKSMVDLLDLGEHVTLAGWKPDDQIADYFAACDVFAMISREIPERGDVEGFGIVFLEANYMGRPVVGGRSGGVPEAVLHEETGLLVDPNDPQDVASAIVRLLCNEELAVQLGSNGRKRVLQEFTGKRATEILLRFLDK